MNILFINPERFTPLSGGIEQCTDTLARGLADLGHKPYYLYTHRILPNDNYESPFPEYVMPTDIQYEYNDECIVFYTDLQRRLGIDVVVFQRAVLDRRFFFLEHALSGVKRIAAVHTIPMHRVDHCRCSYMVPVNSVKQAAYSLLGLCAPYMLKQIMMHKLRKEYLHWDEISDKIVMLSPRYIQRVSDFTGIPSKKFAAIPNSYGYTARRINPKKEKIVLFIGRLTAFEKNPICFVKMWELLYRDHPDWKAIVIGEGPDRSRLEKYVLARTMERISFEKPRSDLNPIYDKASILINTSFYESFGNVLVEAMAHGCVPITSRYSEAASDIFGRNAGVIVQTLNPEDFAFAASRLMSNHSLLQEMSGNAYKRSSEFSPEKYIERWVTLLNGCFR